MSLSASLRERAKQGAQFRSSGAERFVHRSHIRGSHLSDPSRFEFQLTLKSARQMCGIQHPDMQVFARHLDFERGTRAVSARLVFIWARFASGSKFCPKLWSKSVRIDRTKGPQHARARPSAIRGAGLRMFALSVPPCCNGGHTSSYPTSLHVHNL